MTAAAHPPPNDVQGTQHIVLLGAGHTHLQLLVQLAAMPISGAAVTLVAPNAQHMVTNMVPGFMVGHYAPQELSIALQPLVQRAGIQWVAKSVIALDASHKTLQLDDGSRLQFDCLSINTAHTQDRALVEQAIPGAREHALFVQPLEAFTALWPQVTKLGDSRPLRITVIGAGTGGVEMAFAVRQRLPQSAVTLLCGHTPPVARCAPRLQERVINLLKQRNITVLQDIALSITSGFVQLGCGAELACDIPLLATGTLPPAWLADSGLALNDQGFIAVDTAQRSTNHSHIFATGDISNRADHPLERCAAHDRLTGPALAHNLAATVGGSALKPIQPPAVTLNMLACADRYAVGSWGRTSFQGRWVWWLKDRMDRRFVARHQPPG